ncbi:leukocyte surface antigen CD53-like isoform X2 [Girardinichthys multiradiatus]|uniref:leukocyte surface antigen CD53-like isoform X2 n=1 Tax=Girardinichthys multiradiatus TaxID=208333 RepID=UPI001FAC71B3|nr:leukocyte surface antigen CD53-like isoform X2 [Girardinichthys multiradiatus]
MNFPHLVIWTLVNNSLQLRSPRRRGSGRMNSSCVGCLKHLVVSLHFLCWLCGAFVMAFGEFQMMNSSFAYLVTTFWPIYPANTLVVTGAIVTCVCYLGVLGGMRENRCMLITFYVLLFILMLVELAMACVFFVYNKEIDTYFEKDLTHSLEICMKSSSENNKTIKDDLDAVQFLGCLVKLRNWFASNYLSTASGVVTMFMIQFVCLSITIPLFCHFSRRGLGYQ